MWRFKKHTQRKVIVHFHFFKNAGSTVDYILRNNFKDAYENYDLPARNKMPAADGIKYIKSRPHLIALSSHQLMQPLPGNPSLKIFSIFFIRHPIDRAGSIYRHEMRELLLLNNKEMSKKADLRTYIASALDKWPKAGVMDNYHVRRLSSRGDVKIFASKITEERFKLACNHLLNYPFFGVVERFNDSITWLKDYLNKDFAELDYGYTIQNSSFPAVNIEHKLAMMKAEIGDHLYDRFREANQYDMQLYSYAVQIFNKKMRMLNSIAEKDVADLGIKR